jgi:hypothetical protein
LAKIVVAFVPGDGMGVSAPNLSEPSADLRWASNLQSACDAARNVRLSAGRPVSHLARPQWHHIVCKSDEPAGRLADDPPARRVCGYRGRNLLPHVPRDRDHRLSLEWRRPREHAQEMAAHESPRTTKLYDRTKERLTQDEVERIGL